MFLYLQAVNYCILFCNFTSTPMGGNHHFLYACLYEDLCQLLCPLSKRRVGRSWVILWNSFFPTRTFHSEARLLGIRKQMPHQSWKLSDSLGLSFPKCGESCCGEEILKAVERLVSCTKLQVTALHSCHHVTRG